MHRLDDCPWRFEPDGDDDDGDGLIEPLAELLGVYDPKDEDAER